VNLKRKGNAAGGTEARQQMWQLGVPTSPSPADASASKGGGAMLVEGPHKGEAREARRGTGKERRGGGGRPPTPSPMGERAVGERSPGEESGRGGWSPRRGRENGRIRPGKKVKKNLFVLVPLAVVGVDYEIYETTGAGKLDLD
jgi:hypothetical protein